MFFSHVIIIKKSMFLSWYVGFGGLTIPQKGNILFLFKTIAKQFRFSLSCFHGSKRTVPLLPNFFAGIDQKGDFHALGPGYTSYL
ncbi:hypothetical protein Desgi_4358 [Desulfoscipio gibsoniae DSM 7213]|uniref:Uncharacterized protein n=1 Tax=Desulfoscipio gibsoniae DSM 7213 TaxID=767817 RepID=R4KVG2_9FIRM|nr:hypothetical protein Desgi_4358 [Desulfoscipio gibsoniae DSM 7213]